MTVRAARERLREIGHEHDVVLRSLDEVRRIVESTPEAEPTEDVYRTTVSFFDLDVLPEVSLPARSANGLVEVRALGRGHAGAVCWKPKNTAGDVTGFLEKTPGVPVTTRTLGTLRRLVASVEQ
ncbi:MAG: hypothetical protein QM621_11585 [Aeromicrobium sp.]